MAENPADDGRALLEQWLGEIALHPLDESELAHDRLPSMHASADFALQLGPDGVPLWWPSSHPKTGARLTHAQRREFFFEWLARVWDCRDRKVSRGAQNYRRRRLAIELVSLHGEIGEAWEQMPWDESL